MTDAALPVTQSAVERFTDQYLQSLGCTIEKQGDSWDVTIPDTADTELSGRNLRIICGSTSDEETTGEPLHPESQLCQQLLSEASSQHSTGKISIATENTPIEIPGWLRESDVTVRDTQFTPYYDRTAIVVLFRVSIETVSEYQTELLRAIAVDARSDERLPNLEETFLRLTSLDEKAAESDPAKMGVADVRSTIKSARSHLEAVIEERIDEVHQEASRAADAEVEEFRQMQQQRIQELEETRSNLSSKIDDLSERINDSEQADRVQVLEERNELKSEFEEIETDLAELRKRREQGFPERQREIRERHALDVRISPLTLTQVEYERGEVTLMLQYEDGDCSITVGYGSGVGITEDVRCSSCNEELTEDRSLGSIDGAVQCSSCASDIGAH
ncbi:hypothetical protein [Halobacterium rubrum]|uniref:hypothetical protein n=1 Tax=Halobacterium TaxID=2239 RepID=UPI001F1B1687|nr:MULTISPECIES: hypothetical protein [Halobacterium]MDH5020346.1 hypothetical protein [Halobacterium rubrum]